MKVFAHRGASGHFPENTQSAIMAALNIGVDGIEVDVQSALDDYMIIHDTWLDRTTTGKGKVCLFTAAHIMQFDAGNGEKVPTLQQLFNWNNNQTLLNLELKHTFQLENFAAQLEQNIANKLITADNLLVSSFDHHQLAWLKQRLPWLNMGALTASIPLHYAKFAEQLAAYSIHIDKNFINQAFVDDAKQRGLKVYCYTVDKPADIQLLHNYGVDGVFTNYPAATKQHIAQLS
ncbi:glycerophosphodiester phosphodiesterase [Pseudoalteromonas sp.]|uniref:glycerophosphodiester phosphodiesterase n=1 Tax=Pseudoalteromonas sp. TaxID=53249 RepID=UPI003566F22A